MSNVKGETRGVYPELNEDQFHTHCELVARKQLQIFMTDRARTAAVAAAASGGAADVTNNQDKQKKGHKKGSKKVKPGTNEPVAADMITSVPPPSAAIDVKVVPLNITTAKVKIILDEAQVAKNNGEVEHPVAVAVKRAAKMILLRTIF